jgi:hypothetical protein
MLLSLMLAMFSKNLRVYGDLEGRLSFVRYIATCIAVSLLACFLLD